MRARVPTADPRRLRVRGRRLPVSGQRAVGHPARELRASRPASASRSSARTARARRRSPSCSRGSTTRPRGASCSTASTCATTTSRRCASAIGVIFQDFVRYDMRFDENVGVGEIEGVPSYLDAVRDARANGASAPPTALRRRGGTFARLDAAAALRAAATARCSAAASTTASTSRAASGRRSRWRAPTCATRSC